MGKLPIEEERKIILEAQQRFTRCSDWESYSRQLADDDERFYAGDSDNNYQWLPVVYAGRNIPGAVRPCMTINKTAQHCKQIINDARQNKQGIKIIATGGGATYEASQAFMGIVRAIERNSRAQTAYDTATWCQVVRGMGYFRVLTEYAHDGSMDQDIRIQRVSDPKSVYLDPDIQEKDGSDARFGFIFRNIPKEEFEQTYPKYKDLHGANTLGNNGSWDNEHHVRVAEYYRKVMADDELLMLVTGQVVRKSDAGPVPDEHIRSRRTLSIASIEHYLIVGNKIAEKNDWAGKFVPICRVQGEETVIDNKLDRRGHVRALKDPQRSLNYYTSSAIEAVALQTKTPFIGPAAAIEGYENYWDTANAVNHSMIPYNHVDDSGQPIPPPHRAEPPQMPQAYMEGLRIAQEEMMLVSGQYQAILGAPSNETSGKAINARQRQGDNASYHFIDHLALAIRFCGEIIVDLIPHIYDTPRIMRILQEDGDETDLIIDPNAPDAHTHVDPQGQPMPPQAVQQAMQTKGGMEGVRAVFNPTIGKYGVAADVGPAYATKRQEAFNAFMQITSQNHNLLPVIGDLMFLASDMPMAKDIAERLKNMVPAQALGGPPPEVQAMQQHLQQQGALIQQLQAEAAAKGQDATLREYDSETKRMAAIGALDPEAMVPIIRQMVHEAMGLSLPTMQTMHGIQPSPGVQDQFVTANAQPAQVQPGKS